MNKFIMFLIIIMTAGLLQLVKRDKQDLFLIDEPSITFFKSVYKRYTNFSQELEPLLFNTNLGFGKKVSCNIARNGDLINKMYLRVNLPSIPKLYDSITGLEDTNKKFAWVKKIGYALIKNVELEIGGRVIDKHYGEWLNIWYELTESYTKETLDTMIGNIEDLYNFTNGKDQYELFIPLKFWFCKNNGISLPLLAIYYNNIKVNVEINPLEKVLKKNASHYIVIDENVVHFTEGDVIYQGTNKNIFSHFDYNTKRLYYIKYNSDFVSGSTIYNDKYFVNPKTDEISYTYTINYPNNLYLTDANLMVNYIYLDEMERSKFVQNDHEYLIDILEHEGDISFYSNNIKIKSGFTQLSREIFLTAQYKFLKDGNILDRFNYTNKIKDGKNLLDTVKVLLNGKTRVDVFDNEYYNYLQKYNYHSNEGSDGLNILSFSLNPEDNHPNGTCNFGKIDDLTFMLSTSTDVTYTDPGLLSLFSLSYNVLKIKDGLCSLVF